MTGFLIDANVLSEYNRPGVSAPIPSHSPPPHHLRHVISNLSRSRRPTRRATCYPGSEVPQMSTTTITSLHPTPVDRAAINRANSRHSTGPRTDSGKQRSSLNALRHGLTAAAAVLPSEDQAAFDAHRRGFFDEYQPATPTETQLTQELADTAWRLNRIPALEAALLDRAANPPTDQAAIEFDIVDAHRALATLGLHYQRLSRQFQKAVDKLREIQSERRHEQERDLRQAAALLELHKHKGIPYDPSQDGFVYSKDQVEACAERLKRLNQSRHIEYVLFHMQPPSRVASASL